MRSPIALICTLSVAVLAATGAAAQHQHDTGGPPQRVGTVQFATSCDAAVKDEFNRGVALLHSFWFSAAIDAFNEVLAKDPGCAMAHWGIAMSWWGNPFGGFRSPAALAAGRAAVEKALAAAPRTSREQDYVNAVAALYKDYETVDQRTRILSYEKAMEQVASKHGSDPEARIFYALALDQSALPTDHTYANQLKAGAILEKELPAQPDHPGIAHYIIHSYDVPALAPRALDAARRYAKIAPDAPHALHMPSHTFTRVGSWEESIETNLASAAAARKDNAASEELHALDYQVYAYLQLARDAAAKKVLDSLPAIAARIRVTGAENAAPAPAGFFAAAAIPARHALERHAWREAAALEPRPSPFPWVDAMTHFARALGAARSGNPGAAAAEVQQLAALSAALKEKKEGYWAGQVDTQRRVAAAWMAFAQGKPDDGIAMLREAADMEDATEKSAVTPGPLAPARELLGEMLLDAKRPAEALVEFEKTMKKEPNRFRGLYGAAMAAEAAGDATKARTYYAKLVELCQSADAPVRPELEVARKKVRG
jgi:tetratricopeptide (TPR) repeat protein